MRSTYEATAVGKIIISPEPLIASNTRANNAPHKSGFNPSTKNRELVKYFTAKVAVIAKNIMSVTTVAMLAPIYPYRGMKNRFNTTFKIKHKKANIAFNICLFAITIKFKKRTFGNIKRDVHIMMFKATVLSEYSAP